MSAGGEPVGHLWPSAAQALLLRAALTGDAAEADACFAAWRERVDIDRHVDEGSYRLLPLLWSNLVALGVSDPDLPRLKGVLRSSWVESAKRGALAAEVLGALEGAGIPTLVAKGLPLSRLFYEKIALRPMNDLDIVVPIEQVENASAVLRSMGFAPPPIDWQHERALRHALMQRHPERGEVDLHWHMLFECPTRDADAHFWSAAVPMEIDGVPTLRPCATDLLIQVLVHGVRWNLSPPLRWVADAAMILRGHEPVDWERLTGFCLRHHLALRVGRALAYLEDRFALPIPAGTTARLLRRRALRERIELFAMRGDDERSAWRHLRRATYVARLLGADDARRVPRALAAEIARRLQRPVRSNTASAILAEGVSPVA